MATRRPGRCRGLTVFLAVSSSSQDGHLRAVLTLWCFTGASRGVSRHPAAASQWPDPSQVDLLVNMERHGRYFGPGGGLVTMTLHLTIRPGNRRLLL